jgi:Short C-terminal domain
MPLLRGMARTAVVAGTATAVSNRVSRRQGERWAQQDQQQGPQQVEAAPAAAPAGQADYTAELEKLAKLRDDGVITADDFEAKKKQLLGI